MVVPQRGASTTQVVYPLADNADACEAKPSTPHPPSTTMPGCHRQACSPAALSSKHFHMGMHGWHIPLRSWGGPSTASGSPPLAALGSMSSASTTVTVSRTTCIAAHGVWQGMQAVCLYRTKHVYIPPQNQCKELYVTLGSFTAKTQNKCSCWQAGRRQRCVQLISTTNAGQCTMRQAAANAPALPGRRCSRSGR